MRRAAAVARRWLALACLGASGASAAAGSASNAETQALWDDFFAHADRQAVMASYDVVKALGEGVRTPGVAECNEHKDALDHALSVNPVGLGVWYVGYLCADQLGQRDAAAQRLRRFTALVRHGVDTLPKDFGASPMRVVSPIDIEAFIAASGQKVLYQYYDLAAVSRALPVRVALWDDKTQHERWIAFDFVDTFERLLDKPFTAAPASRRAMAHAVLKNFASDGDSEAQQALDLYDASRLGSAEERSAKLTLLAAAGNVQAALRLGLICAAETDATCAPQAIDALLPLVEAHDAAAMVELSAYYAEGKGVEKDEQKARKLLAAADARLGDGRGTLLYASRMIFNPEKGFPPLVRADLETLAEHGNPLAAALTGGAGFDDSTQPQARTIARLRRADEAGLGVASGLLAELLVRQGQHAAAQPILERAAHAHYARAEATLARQFENGDFQLDIARNPERALYWYTEAGTDGDVDAMLWLGRHYRAHADDEMARLTARAWFQSADQLGSTAGALERAAMYRDGLGDDEGNAATALAVYKALSEKRDSAIARRAWSDMLREGSGGVARDLPQARRLLEQDATRGDAMSQYKLGLLLLADGPLHDATAGVDWMRKSADQGNASALNWLGWAYENGKFVEANIATALADYRAAVDKGNSSAMLHLALMAQQGRGMRADDALAFRLLRQSAELDNNEAAWRLGNAYLRGEGTAPDRSAALDWYRRSAEAGNAVGMDGLGVALLAALEPERRAEGVQWLERAAAAGNTAAMNDLGLAYAKGNGVPQDMAKAGDWFAKGVAAGDDDSVTNAALLNLSGRAGPVDATNVRAQLESAVAHGNLRAIAALASLLHESPDGSAEAKRSWELYRRCGDAGHVPCVLALGYGYRYGWVDGKPDLEAARGWYERAPDEPEARAQLIESTTANTQTTPSACAPISRACTSWRTKAIRRRRY